jgi:hypothetical protein
LTDLVHAGTENIFNDDHWKSQDFIIIAVDNGKARRYIDERANWHELTIIESGTLSKVSPTSLSTASSGLKTDF